MSADARLKKKKSVFNQSNNLDLDAQNCIHWQVFIQQI